MRQLTLGSLFDGIGGWQLAAVHAGIRPVWSSEIEAFPLQVTKKHFPQTRQLGDIRNLDGMCLPPVDIICAGSPCQDLSVAGKQKGLAGERSGLFVKAIELVRGMQQATLGRFPRYFVWENVPGAFSSNQRKDFLAVLETIGGCKLPMPRSPRWAPAGLVRTPTCDIAWRVLDAQYFGVPQRRKRIFLVADFGIRQRRASEILFESRPLSRHFEAGRGTQESSPTETPDRPSSTSTDVTYTICGNVIGRKSQNGGHQMGIGKDVMFTLNTIDRHAVLRPSSSSRARRLTPLEWERLQGLPDGWTAGGTELARYKAMGNGMAQPCADFVLRRIAEISASPAI